MICNVDGTWELEPSDIRTYNLVVAKLLQEKAMSNDKTMNVDKFVRYMYKEMLDGLEDEQKALAFTRHTPDAMIIAAMADPNIRKGLAPKGYKTEDVEKLKDMFEASLQAVSNFVTPKVDNTVQEIASQVKAATTAASLQPEPKPAEPETPEKTARKDKNFDLPYNPLATTGNELIPGREWYYGFIKKLSNVMLSVNGISTDGTVGMPGVDGGIRITMVLGEIPKNQLYPDEQQMSDADIERYTSNAMYSVVTNSKGDFVYFDDNYNVTTEEAGGRLIYFPTRTIPTSTVNELGERQFKLSEQTGKSIQTIADRSRKGETVEAVTKEYNDAYNALYDMRAYLTSNLGSRLLLDITGVDNGTINYDKNAEVSLRSVKNIDGFTATATGTAKRNYVSIKLTNGATVPLVMRPYSPSLASKVADFITSNVFTSDGKLLTPIDKLNSLKTFTRTSGAGKIAIDEQNAFVILGNQIVRLDDPEVKTKIVDFLTRIDTVTKNNGETVEYANQLYFNADVYAKNQSVDEFELIPTENGYEYKSQPKVYNEWIKDNSYLPVVLDDKGNIRELNGYIKFAPNTRALNILQPEAASSEQATEIAKDQTEITIENMTMGNFEPTYDVINDAINSGQFSPDKLFSMRDENTSATNAQSKRGKKWFDTTEVKFKDANGKTVTKKLSEVIPYKTLFNVVNSGGNVLATWTRNGVTLYNGSDYTALYHEAWHGFTQLFLTSDQKQKLYNEVKALAQPIRYYNQDAATWETMNSKDLDFSNKNHVLYAEEFLADEYREYAKNRKSKSVVFKNIFKKIWEAIKGLFSKSSKSSVANIENNPIIQKAFNELYVGDLSNYTYDQANIQFNSLNSGINYLSAEQGAINSMDIADSLDMAEAMNYFVSNFIDSVNSKYGTSGYTINTLIDNEYKKLALKHALVNFKKYANGLANTIKDLNEGYVKLKLQKRLAIWQTAIDNFGDVENLSNNKDKGTIAFYNKRTGFLDIKGAATEKELAEQTDENTIVDGEMSAKGTDKSGTGATDGTESSSFDRVDAAVLFTMASVYDRTESTPNNKEGLIFNAAGGTATANPRKVFNILSSETDGIKDRTEMYNALALAAKRLNKDGQLKPESRIIEQFLSKIGKPGSGRMGSEMLWNKLYKSLRYDRVRGRKFLTTTKTDVDYKTGEQIDTILMTVAMPDSGFKAVQRKFEDSFQSMSKNKSSFKLKNKDGEVILNLNKLAEKYLNADISGVDPIEFFNDFGIPISDNYKSVQKIKAKRIIPTIFKYRLRELLEKKNQTIKSIKDLLKTQDTQYDELAKIEAEANYNFSDYMIKNAEEESQSERSNPSAAGSVITDINNFDHYDQLIANPATSHFDKNRNPYVKTSLIFKRLFGDALKGKKTYQNDQKAYIELTNLLGSQVLEETATGKALLEGVKSSDSSEETAYMRDLFFYTLEGASEAYRHADKSMSYVAKLAGDPSVRFYVHPKLFTQKSSLYGNEGVKEANKIMYGYIASELERIKKVKNGVYATGEKPSDIILYTKKDGGYETFEGTGSKFTVFDEILPNQLKDKLINDESINTVEDLLALINSNENLQTEIDDSLNNYFKQEFAKDKAKFDSFGLNGRSTQLTSLGRTLGTFTESNANQMYEAAIQSFTYASFIHKFEMNTLIYGDPAIYNHLKDEHMKRIPAFFAAGPIPVTDKSTEEFLQANPGGYANSQYYKSSNLDAPTPGLQERRILDTAVLEDAIEDSAYYDTMVKFAMDPKNAGWSKKKAEARYAPYKNMKSADAQAWITFDAYRGLEIRLGNWGPIKEQLYWDIINGKSIDAERLEQFFPVKKYQYAGPISTSNFSVNGFHKYSVMPLIPTVIKGTRLEALHNKMISQGVAYSVMHTGSKLASIGKNGKLSLFYKEQKGDNTPAFTDVNYKFDKTPIFLEYLKQQVVTADEFKGQIKFPSQVRKLITSGLMELGLPHEFMPGAKAEARREAWAKEKDKSKYPSYALEKVYTEGIDKMITVAENQLKRELGYSEGKISLQRLIEFVKKNLEKRDVSEYDLKFIQLGSDGTLLLPLDLANDPSKIEKLISSIVNKRVVDQMSNGDQYVQGSGIGFEKFSKPKDTDLTKYGTNGLRFYEPILNDKKEVIGIKPMQVKIALHGDFKKLLKHKDNDGKVIGTIERLNQLLKDEKWLETNRRLITLTGVRIPTQGVNSVEAMEIAEFLPEEAGNVMIVPSDIVAKSGGDFDIDKLVTLIPPIEYNNGIVELKSYTETSKSLEDIIKLKHTLNLKIDIIKERYDVLYDKESKKSELTDAQVEELKNISEEYNKKIEDAKNAYGVAYTNFLNNFFRFFDSTKYLGKSLEDDTKAIESAQATIDRLREEQLAAKKEFGRKAFGENFLNEFNEKRKKALDAVYSDLRSLQKEQNSFKADSYQNNLMKSMIDILLRPDNYMNLTLPNDTELYEGANGPWETFKDVNKPESKSKSPTRIMKNSYNIEKAIAMHLGKASIGMLATGNTFFSLYKSIGLTMNPTIKVRDKKSDTGFIDIPQRLLLNHNSIDGNISLSHTMDASGENDIAELISQLMNGYLDVAKKTWTIDINASKEFESQLEFMLLAGVPVMDAVAMLSQPWVREYLEYTKKYSDPQQVAKRNVQRTNMAAYEAAQEVFRKHNITGLNTNAAILKEANTRLSGLKSVSFEDLKKGALGKQDDLFNERMFLHFLEITAMAKGNKQLKRTLNFDTDKKQSLFEISQKENNLNAMSDQFSKKSINSLLTKTVLKNFRTYDIMEAAVSALLPLRGINNVNKFLATAVNNLDLNELGKQRYYNGFINDLTLYMYRNYTDSFDKNADTYRGAVMNADIDVKQQPLLSFGAYASKDGFTLYVDNNSIATDFQENNYTKSTYGKGELAPLPEGTFTGYPKDKALNLYTHFVYEREFLRVAYPYDTIESNEEFELFRERRVRFFPEADAKTKLPQMWEEFLRNKAMANVRLDEGLYVSNYAKGTVSKAQQLFDLIEKHPDLERLYPVLGELKILRVEGKEFITLRSKLKDADILTSYTSQMSKLMDPGELKAVRKEDSDMISEFFKELPIIAFQQAGNNSKSDLYIGDLFDQTTTGIPQFLQPALDKFIQDLKETRKSIDILLTFNNKYRLKGLGQLKYVNYTASPEFALSNPATTPATTTGHSGGAAGADTKWDQIGQEFGPITFKHYYTGERSPQNAPLGNVDITGKFIALEGAEKVAKAAKEMWGYKYSTMKDQRLVRNWAQVANSDAVYAVAPIGKQGDIWSEDVSKKEGEQRIVSKSEIVQGGTGYAVEMAIQAGKAVYVYNDVNAKAQSHLPKGWYEWNGKNFVAIDTPTLTKNFAGIGSRGMSADAEQAIRDVYTKTFGKSGKVTEDVYSQLGNKTESPNLVISNIKTKDGKYDRAANIKEAQSNNRVYSMETNSDLSFSNPWAHFKRGDTIKTATTKEAVQNYIDWLTTDKFKDIKPERREWILNQLKSGSLKGKAIQYYAELNEPSHATALDYLINKYAEPTVANKVLEGDIFALPGIPVITTNLGGVHGAGLAQAAKAKGLIKQGEGTFSSSDSVVTLPVKLKWSDDMSMNNNMTLLQDSLNGLVNVAKANPQRNYLLPLAGLGHGEGSVEKILPLLINTVKAANNIQLVLPAEDVNLGRQGTVRKDYTRENMPKIKAMLTKAGLIGNTETTGVTEGVQELFESNPELAKVGTVAQYSEYLKSIFPGSKVRNILYHGTYQDFERFSKDKRGSTTGLGKITDNKRGQEFDYDSANAFFFSNSKTNAISYSLLGRNNYLVTVDNALRSVGMSRYEEKAQAAVDFLKTIPYFNNLIEKSKAEGKTKEEIIELLRNERSNLHKKFNRDDVQRFTNTINNVNIAKEEFTKFLSEVARFKASDPNIESKYGILSEYNGGNATGTHRIFYKPNEGGYELVSFEGNGLKDAKRNFASNMTEAEIKAFFERGLQKDQEALALNEAKMKKAGYAKKVLPVILNLQNPLSHDYENSPFPDTYKETNYPTEYIAARQVARALSEGNDGVIYENITDPITSSSYGVFEPEQIHILGNKQDIQGFKNFVENPANDQRIAAELEQPESNFIKVQNSLTRRFDYTTNKLAEPALIYDDLSPASADMIREIGEQNPNTLFVFEDEWPRASGLRNTLPSTSQKRVWAQFAPQGISFGLSTVDNPDFRSLDANYDKLVPMIDAQIEALKEKRDQGKKIVFPSLGVGQNLVGVIYKDGKLTRGKTVPAPNLFVYLSKRLLQEFGFQNPVFNRITMDSGFSKKDIIDGKATAAEYIQDYYKEKGLQNITDSEILEQQKQCKGKA